MLYPAHLKESSDGTIVLQSVAEHCRGSAESAAASASDQFKKTAYLATLLHDMGKYTDGFREYITKAFEGQPARRGSVNHTFAGVRFVLERWHTPETDPIQLLTSEILAYAIGAHHGLFDCVDPAKNIGFTHRMTKEGIGYDEAKSRFLSDCADTLELDALFSAAKEEMSAAFTKLSQNAPDEDGAFFLLSILTRLISALVIDGDRRDTIQFMFGVENYGK